MLQVQGVSVEIGGRLVVDDASFTIMPRDKVGLVGRNGAGKTSFFKVLGGESEPIAGKILRKGGFGYLPQDPRIEGGDQRTAITHVLSGRGIDDQLVRIEKLRIAMEEDTSERNVARFSRAQDDFASSGGYAADSEARSIAAGLGLQADRMDLPVGVLSGGEKRRVELARILFAGSDALLLDEPTNHLDIDSRESLIHALNEFPGAVILISHDRHLLQATADRLWLVKDGAVNPYEGDLEDYKTLVTGVSGDRRGKREAEKASKADRRRDAAARRAALEPLAKEIRATEALMDRIRKRIDGIEDELANPAIYEKDPSTATRLAKERSQLAQTLSGHEEKWLTMSAEYEEGTAE
jgi:ATPase subunit of ABC transporter with duplicated ATPase domains